MIELGLFLACEGQKCHIKTSLARVKLTRFIILVNRLILGEKSVFIFNKNPNKTKIYCSLNIKNMQVKREPVLQQTPFIFVNYMG